jgi:hypothetical protein
MATGWSYHGKTSDIIPLADRWNGQHLKLIPAS